MNFQWIWIHSPITLISNVTQTNKLSQRKNEKGIGYRGGQKYYNFCCKLKNDDSFRHDTYMTINREAKGPLNHGLSVARYLQKKFSQIYWKLPFCKGWIIQKFKYFVKSTVQPISKMLIFDGKNLTFWEFHVLKVQNSLYLKICKLQDLQFWQILYTYNVIFGQNLSNFHVEFHKNCQITMLQKLWKCEVKAWLCWNLIILLSPQFYARSNIGDFKRSKNVIFGNFRDSDLWILVDFGLETS